MGWEEVTLTNRKAMACMALCKLSGLAFAILLFTSHRTGASVCLWIAALSLVSSLVLCRKALKLANALDRADGTAI